METEETNVALFRPASLGLIRAYEGAAALVEVPAGYVGVVARDRKVVNVLPSGRHSLPSSPFTAVGGDGVSIAQADGTAVYLVNAEPVEIPWECEAVISSSRPHGLTYTTVRGRCEVRVTDPAGHFAAMFAAAAEVGKQEDPGSLQKAFPTFTRPGKRGASYAHEHLVELADVFVPYFIHSQVAECVRQLKLAPERASTAHEEVRAAGEVLVANALRGIGCQPVRFTVDHIDEPARVPCVQCGSETAPTAYAAFRRNISLFFVRFTAGQEGNFCVPCALKTALGWNVIMLFVGWWGTIGAILTPVYSLQNLYHLGGVLFGQKTPVRRF